MAEFHKLLARLKGALEKPQAAGAHDNHVAPARTPVAAVAQRAELASAFARELVEVSGRFLGNLTATEAAAKVTALARENAAKNVAIGEGVVTKMSLFSAALESAGCTLMKPRGIDKGQQDSRPAMIAQFANCDIGIAEAHYAIASTGTFAVMTAEARPSSLTLLPPISVIIVNIDRVVTNLAAALAAFGADAIATNRVSFITGPSRTADIEKRIVMGVHGPKMLCGAIIWPDHE
ncbi:MAG TPA: LUD domain-containing protein [Candidatus Binataceae bacterium]|nr:LUD domain-containing protein [Candidatus Binataceae bacterium]